MPATISNGVAGRAASWHDAQQGRRAPAHGLLICRGDALVCRRDASFTLDCRLAARERRCSRLLVSATPVLCTSPQRYPFFARIRRRLTSYWLANTRLFILPYCLVTGKISAQAPHYRDALWLYGPCAASSYACPRKSARPSRSNARHWLPAGRCVMLMRGRPKRLQLFPASMPSRGEPHCSRHRAATSFYLSRADASWLMT